MSYLIHWSSVIKLTTRDAFKPEFNVCIKTPVPIQKAKGTKTIQEQKQESMQVVSKLKYAQTMKLPYKKRARTLQFAHLFEFAETDSDICSQLKLFHSERVSPKSLLTAKGSCPQTTICAGLLDSHKPKATRIKRINTSNLDSSLGDNFYRCI